MAVNRSFYGTLVVATLVCGVSEALAQRSSRDWEAERRRMVAEQLGARDIRSGRVLNAMRRVPRHLFVPEAQRAEAYRVTCSFLKPSAPRPTAILPCQSATSRPSPNPTLSRS